MTTLLQEIQAKCTPQQIAAQNCHDIAATVSAGRTAVFPGTYLNDRDVLGTYPDGPLAADALMTTLETYAAVPTNQYASVVNRAIGFLKQGTGIDFGNPATDTLFGALATAGVITQDQCNKLIGLATKPAPVTWQQVQFALVGV